MRKIYFSLVLSVILIGKTAFTQTVANFDSFALDSESSWNGADGSGSFQDAGFIFKNEYNAEYGSWSGFAYTNMTDVSTPGWANQYSAITGSGQNGSVNYAVSYAPSEIEIDNENGLEIGGMYVTNSTYAYLSMLNGDDYAKKFGGEDGTDQDFFLLTVEGFDTSGESTGKVEFYLADFRAEGTENDYILNTWEWVDLSTLGTVKKLSFSLISSDNGDWGMNTPGYFCLDNLTAKQTTTSIESKFDETEINIYPNPAKNFIKINSTESISGYEVIDLTGKCILKSDKYQATENINIEMLTKGIYLIKIKAEGSETIKKFVKS